MVTEGGCVSSVIAVQQKQIFSYKYDWNFEESVPCTRSNAQVFCVLFLLWIGYCRAMAYREIDYVIRVELDYANKNANE